MMKRIALLMCLILFVMDRRYTERQDALGRARGILFRALETRDTEPSWHSTIGAAMVLTYNSDLVTLGNGWTSGVS